MFREEKGILIGYCLLTAICFMIAIAVGYGMKSHSLSKLESLEDTKYYTVSTHRAGTTTSDGSMLGAYIKTEFAANLGLFTSVNIEPTESGFSKMIAMLGTTDKDTLYGVVITKPLVNLPAELENRLVAEQRERYTGSFTYDELVKWIEPLSYNPMISVQFVS